MGIAKYMLRAGVMACCLLAVAQSAKAQSAEAQSADAQAAEAQAAAESAHEAEAVAIKAQAPTVKTYKQNFFLHAKDSIDQDGRQQEETEFQISFKKRMIDWAPLFFGYTQKSFWQIYDHKESSPFRENNFNPEIFLDRNIGGWKGALLALQGGFEHESNGRGLEYDEAKGEAVNMSRSWNRWYLHPKIRVGDRFIVALKRWWRHKEDPKENINDAEGDDNKDIEEFLGHGELRISVKPVSNWDFQVLTMYRDGSSPAHDTYQVDLIIRPCLIFDGVYCQLHYFNGYGESLIDYNRRVKKVGIGFAAGNPFASMFPK